MIKQDDSLGYLCKNGEGMHGEYDGTLNYEGKEWKCADPVPKRYSCLISVSADEPGDLYYTKDEEKYKNIKQIISDPTNGIPANFLINDPSQLCFSDCTSEQDFRNDGFGLPTNSTEEKQAKYYCTNPESSKCELRYFSSSGFKLGDKTCAANNSFDPRGHPTKSECEKTCYPHPPPVKPSDLPTDKKEAEEKICDTKYMVPYDGDGNPLWTIDNYPAVIKANNPNAGGPLPPPRIYGTDYDTNGLVQSFGCSTYNNRWPVGDDNGVAPYPGGNCTIWMMNHSTPRSGNNDMPDYFCRTDNAYPAQPLTCNGDTGSMHPLTDFKNQCKAVCRHGPNACKKGYLGDFRNLDPKGIGLYLYKDQNVECWGEGEICLTDEHGLHPLAACCKYSAASEKKQLRCLSGTVYVQPGEQPGEMRMGCK